MPVGVDEYLRRSIRHFKAGLAAHKLRFARVRACRNQLKAVVEQAGKYDIDLSEIGLADWSGLPELATTAKVGGEGVCKVGVGLNLNQSIPDSKNSQYLARDRKEAENACNRADMAVVRQLIGESVLEQPVASGELKAALEWPLDGKVRIVGGCPNPRLMRGSLEDGRGVSLWSKGVERERVGNWVLCVKVGAGVYRRK